MHATDTIEHRGFTISIYQDESPSCPWRDWDGQPPLWARNRDGLTEYGDPDVWNILNEIPDIVLDEKREIVLDLLKVEAQGADIEAEGWETEVIGAEFGEGYEFPDWAREELGGIAGEDWDVLEELCDWAGITCYRATSQGYSQSCWADLFIYYPPSFLKDTGIAKDNEEKAIEGDFRLWGQWAWGDVYGYTVADPDGEDTDDSCWGFFGDPEDSGLLEEAKRNIDHEIERRKTLNKETAIAVCWP